MFLFKNHGDKETGRLVPDLLSFFLKKTGGGSKWYVAYFQYFLIVLNMICSKNILYETYTIDQEIF